MAKEKWDTDWLIFSRKTRRGAFSLLFIFFIVAISPRIYQLIFTSNEETVLTYQPIKEASPDNSKASLSNPSNQKEQKNIRQFPKDKSDPNTFTKSEWEAIGLSEKQAETVLNFKKSIGGFKSFKDLEKVYVFDDQIISALKQNIAFDKKSNNTAAVIKDSVTNENQDFKDLNEDGKTTFEINTATKEDLLTIKGIGPFFAEKIIEQRQAIGGFVELKQLLSIYNFDEDKLSEIKPYLTVDKNNVSKLDLNLVTVNQLKKHPEINWDTAKSIVDLRSELGAFTSLDQLLLSVYIDSKKYRQIVPYFKIK